MIYAVYFKGTTTNYNTLVAGFLMKEDAEFFVEKYEYSRNYEIAEIDGCWSEWSRIREEIK